MTDERRRHSTAFLVRLVVFERLRGKANEGHQKTNICCLHSYVPRSVSSTCEDVPIKKLIEAKL